MFAALHVATYLWSVLRRNWREMYTPGVLWVAGLILGILAFTDMVALGVTSRDASVKKMGGRKWKRLHRTIYLAVVVVFLHALFVGADFGLNRGPDVKGEAEFGSLIAFGCISASWLALVVFRHRGWRWTPRFMSETRSSR